MTQPRPEFARLLTEGIYRIRSLEGKSISIIQDELGYALGREGGTAVEYWRRGHSPNLDDLELLGRLIFERGQMELPWLHTFLRQGGHPSPQTVLNHFPAAYVDEDGRFPTKSNGIHPPQSEFNAQYLAHLEAPGGTIPLRDTFYIEREADGRLRHQLMRPGCIITIRAPRQTGKSSMLIRALAHARQQDADVLHLDMQRVDENDLADSDTFLFYLAGFIARKRRLPATAVADAWQDDIGGQDRLTFFLEDHVLNQADAPIVLAIDEADRLLETNFHTSFFALLRFWHNQAAFDMLWEKLHLALVISTEPYLLISDVNQSPFNAGPKLYLQDFDQAQVEALNQRHGAPVSHGGLPAFMHLLNGHPYLTRQALYTLVTQRITWPAFTAVAATADGPFADHLQRQQWLLQQNPALNDAFQRVLHDEACEDPLVRYRLLRAGLIHASGETCTCRCDLYRRYFG